MFNDRVTKKQRFREENRCPVCDGADEDQRGRGERCFGFLSSDGFYAHCTREEFAGRIQVNADSDTFAHRLDGPCRCGERHDAVADDSYFDETSDIVATYDYEDQDGALIFQILRMVGKRFKTRRPDGRGGWINNLGDISVVLYMLPKLKAADLSIPVYIVEGEQDVDTLSEAGLLSTANPFGAGKWKQEFSEVLKGRDVVLLPDNDNDGRKHSEEVALSLFGIAESVKVLELPDLRPHGDVSDWLLDGRSIKELTELSEQAPVWEPSTAQMRNDGLRFRTAVEFCEETPDKTLWIAEPWVPVQGITSIDGKVRSAGKTTFTLAMVRAILDGSPFLEAPTEKTSVVYLAEGGPTSFREGLRRADLENRSDFHVIMHSDTIGTTWKTVVDIAGKKCLETGSKLLVVDTLSQYTGLRGDSENNTGTALESMEPLQKLVPLGISVVVLRHERKAGGEVGDSARGGSAWSGTADVIISIRRNAGNSSPTVRKLSCMSRFQDTPENLVIEFLDGSYIHRGNETHVALQSAKEKILEVAPTAEGYAATADELIQNAGVTKTTGKEAIKELSKGLHRNELQRIGKGAKGNPFRYFAPKSV